MQWGLQSAALLSPMMVSTSTILGGVLFVAAGIYQWTPLKYACLKHCRSPMAFIMGHWRPGRMPARCAWVSATAPSASAAAAS